RQGGKCAPFVAWRQLFTLPPIYQANLQPPVCLSFRDSATVQLISIKCTDAILSDHLGPLRLRSRQLSLAKWQSPSDKQISGTKRLLVSPSPWQSPAVVKPRQTLILHGK